MIRVHLTYIYLWGLPEYLELLTNWKMNAYLTLHKICLQYIKTVFNRKRRNSCFQVDRRVRAHLIDNKQKVFHIFLHVDIFIIYVCMLLHKCDCKKCRHCPSFSNCDTTFTGVFRARSHMTLKSSTANSLTLDPCVAR